MCQDITKLHHGYHPLPNRYELGKGSSHWACANILYSPNYSKQRQNHQAPCRCVFFIARFKNESKSTIYPTEPRTPLAIDAGKVSHAGAFFCCKAATQKPPKRGLF